ncbi:MAG: hypothetical protein QOI75_6438 [Pseudonocardiales bacterium]|nr:hypothetical protein [Pseudonocardiales bacterium]
MRLTVVGSGDAFGSGGRFQTCIAVSADPTGPPRVLVDCGATSLTAMRQQRLDPNDIDTVLVSHLHGDHFGGLPFLVLDGQFRRRTEDLTVVGPVGTGTRLEQAMEALYPGSTGVRRRLMSMWWSTPTVARCSLGRCGSPRSRCGTLRVLPLTPCGWRVRPDRWRIRETPSGPTRCWMPQGTSRCSCARAIALTRCVGTSTLTPWRAIAIGSPAGNSCSRTCLRRH